MSSTLYTFGFLLVVLTRKVESVNFEQSSARVVNKGTKELRIDCSHDDSSLAAMLWYQQSGQSMTLIGFTVLQSSPTYENHFKDRFQIIRNDTLKGCLIIRNLNLSDSAVYFCAASRTSTDTQPAYFGQGTKLTVLETNREITGPTKVEILEPSEYECRNSKDRKRKKTLVCVASGFYPDHVSVSWIINDITVTDNVATDDAAHENGITYRITSRLRVYAPEWEHPGNTFKCNVTFFNGTGYTYHYSNEIHGVEAQAKGMTRDTFLTATQNFKLTYAVFIAKSCVYGVFVGFLVWKLQRSGGKQRYLDPR